MTMPAIDPLDPRLLKDGVGASRVFVHFGTNCSVHAFLCRQFPNIAPSEWLARLDQGLVLDAQGNALNALDICPTNQLIYYFREVLQEAKLPYEAQVLFEDEHLVLADKPHFLPVIPSGGYVQETLLIRLKRLLNAPELSPLHRIDRDTAGLVLFSKRTKDRGAYQALFRGGKIHKIYEAIAPNLKGFDLPFELHLRLEPAANFMQMRVVSGEANSKTTVISCKPIDQAPDFALYQLSPITGKRHQLRVHMQHLGSPIMGDQIYPELMPERDISQLGHAPLQLLAKSLAFIDPLNGQARNFLSQRHLKLTA